MTGHRVRLFYSTNGADSFHGWLDTWLTNMEPWAAPDVDNTLPQLWEPPDVNGECYKGELAFGWTEDRAIILDQLAGYLDAYCEWWLIGYHECTHDDTGEPCKWSGRREAGPVPAYVEPMEPAPV